MAKRNSSTTTLVDWGVAARPGVGRAVSGDAYVVKPSPDRVLLAAMDGLGKDIEAAAAARTAVGVLRKYGAGSIVSLIKRCHRSLMMTRGAVMTLAAVDSRANLHWLGIGNVEAVLLRADAAAVPAVERLRLQGGVVGYQLPILTERKRTLQPGDMLALATDGIQGILWGSCAGRKIRSGWRNGFWSAISKATTTR